MPSLTRSRLLLAPLALLALLLFGAPSVRAEDAAALSREARDALDRLVADNPAARELAKTARGILVFPDVLKAGFLFGGEYGAGVLFKGEEAHGYYRTVAASYGLQIGAQSFGYALFFMDPKALEYLDRSDGWEIGVGPTVVVLDKGAAQTFSTTTAKDDIYAFTFDQQGLMAGIGIEGSKITRFEP
jgi:lipid-binding SYLF domain-containing protein